MVSEEIVTWFTSYLCMLCYRWLSNREEISPSKTSVLIGDGVKEISK